MIEITDKPIDVNGVIESVRSTESGAIVPFLGTVRHDNGIRELFYESYKPMAIQEMEEIVRKTRKMWPVKKVSIIHRIGRIPAGEASIVIAVASPHRKEAFQACQFVIDEIKERVPIWKSDLSPQPPLLNKERGKEGVRSEDHNAKAD